MKKDMIAFFIEEPCRFAQFCCYLIAGEPVYWKGHALTNAETREIYTAMREIFPGRKDG